MTKHDRLTQLIHRAAEDAAPDTLDLWPHIVADVETHITPRAQRPPQRRAWSTLTTAAPILVVTALLVGALVLLKGIDDRNGGIHSAALNDSGTPTMPGQLTMTMIMHEATATSATLTPTPIPADLVATVVPTPSPIPPDVFMTPGAPPPADLIASVVPTPIPAESLDPATTALEAYGTVGRFHLREAPSDDAPAIALLDGGRMTVLDRREVGGELWYQVRVITTSGLETGWVNARYVNVLPTRPLILETTDIMSRDFVDGVYTHSATLTHDEPRHIYTMEAQQLTPDLLAGERWLLARVDGAYRTPLLSVEHADQSFTTFERYTSDEGAVLFRIPTGTDTSDLFHFAVDGYAIQTHGDYTFTLRPVKNAIAIDATPQTVSLRQDQPVVLRFDLPDDKAARLQIDTLQAMSMDEALTSRMLPQPQVTVLLPHGETLATYHPRRSEALSVTFMPPMQGQQHIVLNPVDLCLPDMTQEDCAAYTRSGITLSVSIQPAETPRRLAAPPQPSAGNTLIWLGCRSTLWEGTPPARSPLAAYEVLAQDAAAIELGAEYGTPVQAAGAGTVIYAGWLADGYGSTVVIAHGESYSIYGHLGLIYTHCGDHVDAGDRIASVGTTGNVAESSLRFEVRGPDFTPRDVTGWIDF